MSHLSHRTGCYRYVGVDPCRSLPFFIEMTGTDRCDPGYRVVRPRSPLSVVGLTLRGEGTVEENGRVYAAPPGSLFIVTQGESHTYAPRGEWEFCWVNITGEGWRALMEYYGLMGRTVFPDFPLGEAFAGLVRDAAERNAEPLPWQLDMQMFLFRTLLVLRGAVCIPGTPTLAGRLRDALEASIGSGESQEALCSRIGVSARHAQRVFRAAWGMSMHAYLADQRMRRARALLIHTGSSIGQIAAQLGFADEKYFSTFFRRREGTSPTAYRAMGHRGDGGEE